jgi:hypothetical protein
MDRDFGAPPKLARNDRRWQGGQLNATYQVN